MSKLDQRSLLKHQNWWPIQNFPLNSTEKEFNLVFYECFFLKKATNNWLIFSISHKVCQVSFTQIWKWVVYDKKPHQNDFSSYCQIQNHSSVSHLNSSTTYSFYLYFLMHNKGNQFIKGIRNGVKAIESKI